MTVLIMHLRCQGCAAHDVVEAESLTGLVVEMRARGWHAQDICGDCRNDNAPAGTGADRKERP